MTEEKPLTKSVAEQFVANPEALDFDEFTVIEEEAAQVLAKYNGELSFKGLTSLSEGVASELASHRGGIGIHIPQLAESAARALFNQIRSITVEYLSDSVAQWLSKSPADDLTITITGPEGLSPNSAHSLSMFQGESLWLFLKNMNPLTAEQLIRFERKLIIWLEDCQILSEDCEILSDATIECLCRKPGYLQIEDAQFLTPRAIEMINKSNQQRKKQGDPEIDFYIPRTAPYCRSIEEVIEYYRNNDVTIE